MDRAGAVACGCEVPTRATDWLRVGLGLVISGQLMALSLARNLSVVDAASQARISVALLALTALGAALLGPELVTATRRALARGDVSVEATFALALTGGLGASLWGLWTGGDVFFEVVTVVLVVHALGARLKERFWAAALDRVARHWVPARVTRLVGGRPVEDAPADLRHGDRILLHAGDRVAADARVVDGAAWIDTSSLDGQLDPRPVGVGDEVPGGALVVRGRLQAHVRAAPDDGAHSRALAGVLEAIGRDLPSTTLSRRVARWFAPIVATVALTAGGVWTWLAGPEEGFRVGTAVLLVACPCGLGVATPVALWAAAAELGRRGIVVNRLAAIEALAGARAAVLDKTGTLTAIAPEVVWRPEPDVDDARLARVRGWVARLESLTDHPVAAVLRGDGAGEVRDVRDLDGGGVGAEVVDGDTVARLILTPRRDVRGLEVRVDGERVAQIALIERLADDAGALVDGLAARGLHVEVLTGDAVAPELDVPCRVGLAPAEKAERVRALRERGVVFVGDAANDLVALAESDVAVTLDGAREGVAARVDLRIGRPSDLLPAIDQARAARERLGRLVAGSIATNTVGVTIAAAGLLHPVVAALLMAGSSLGVTLAAVPGGHDG